MKVRRWGLDKMFSTSVWIFNFWAPPLMETFKVPGRGNSVSICTTKQANCTHRNKRSSSHSAHTAPSLHPNHENKRRNRRRYQSHHYHDRLRASQE